MADKWCCMKCGGALIDIQTFSAAQWHRLVQERGGGWVCLDCKILYTLRGTGVDGSLFIAGAEELTIKGG